MERIKVNTISTPPIKDNIPRDSSSTFNKVYTGTDRNSNIEINPEFIYCTIPKDYVCTYHKLINYLADAGKEIIDDCSFTCKGSGKKLFNCWGLFQAACAAYQQEDYTRANFYFNYVNQQLEDYYKDLGKDIYNGGNYYPITPDGHLKALCSCNNLETRFYVDVETSKLYQEYLETKDDGETFTITENGNLNVQSLNKV